MKSIAPSFLMTEKERKIREADKKYKEKLARREFKPGADIEQIRFLYEQLYSAINLGHFSTKALQDRGHLLEANGMRILLNDMVKSIDIFKSKIPEDRVPVFQNSLNEIEDFIFAYTAHNSENRKRIRKFVISLHSKKH